MGCTGLTSITVDSENTVYDSRNNCNAIIETATNTLISGCKNTVIPDSVTSIGNWVFYDCTGLTSVIIPDSVTSIDMWAFSGCTGLTSITIPNSVTSIGIGTFHRCSSLKSIDLPSSITTIYPQTFSCSGLERITIPEGVTYIGHEAFCMCGSLREVSLPSTLEGIYSSGTFSSCSKLEAFYFRNTESVWNARNLQILSAPDVPIYFIHEHSYTSSVTIPVSCYADGVMTYTCKCGESYTEPIVSNGHNFVDGVCTNCKELEFPVIDEPDAHKEATTFIERISAFFEQILDWFKNLFNWF